MKARDGARVEWRRAWGEARAQGSNAAVLRMARRGGRPSRMHALAERCMAARASIDQLARTVRR